MRRHAHPQATTRVERCHVGVLPALPRTDGMLALRAAARELPVLPNRYGRKQSSDSASGLRRIRDFPQKRLKFCLPTRSCRTRLRMASSAQSSFNRDPARKRVTIAPVGPRLNEPKSTARGSPSAETVRLRPLSFATRSATSADSNRESRPAGGSVWEHANPMQAVTCVCGAPSQAVVAGIRRQRQRRPDCVRPAAGRIHRRPAGQRSRNLGRPTPVCGRRGTGSRRPRYARNDH